MTEINLKINIEKDASAEEILQTILASRGHQTDVEQKAFLHPPAPTLSMLLKETGIKQSVLVECKKILDVHIEAGDDICVFGDYDADGITATAVLWQALMYYTKGKQVRILPFLPDRHRHGYGLSVNAIKEIMDGQAFQSTKYPDFSPKLIITVDNGIVAHEAAQLLLEKGVGLIITDHHEPTNQLPNALLTIHTITTSGAGIAWIVALALLNENDFSQTLIELATIGIVADMMPLIGLNRAIVTKGLIGLSSTRRLGLQAMYTSATITGKQMTTYDINYRLAPRLNAAGRLHDPYDALRLLCATNRQSAEFLAEQINAHNEERQLMTEATLQEAIKIAPLHKVVIVAGEYHEGIIGLVSGKLTELFHKPTIVMSRKADKYKASARSVPGLNITELLRSLATPYLSLGGHSAAAGFSLTEENFNAFCEELYTLADQIIPDELLEKKIVADMELIPSQVTLTLAKLLGTLEPFGMGNPKPKFLFRNLEVLEDRELGQTGKHHKLFVACGDKSLEILLFNTQEQHPLKKIKALIATIDINLWQEREAVQLIGSYVEA